MEKLIELLNEYRESEFLLAERREKIWQLSLGNYSSALSELILISKKYGFIKWLVDNDKVNWDNKDIAIKEWVLWKSIDNYHSLLMVLAIQDEPIDFLVSILK